MVLFCEGWCEPSSLCASCRAVWCACSALRLSLLYELNRRTVCHDALCECESRLCSPQVWPPFFSFLFLRLSDITASVTLTRCIRALCAYPTLNRAVISWMTFFLFGALIPRLMSTSSDSDRVMRDPHPCALSPHPFRNTPFCPPPLACGWRRTNSVGAGEAANRVLGPGDGGLAGAWPGVALASGSWCSVFLACCMFAAGVGLQLALAS